MTSIVPMPRGMRRFSLDEIPAEPWRNGGGRTRTVAALGHGDEVDWRISAADITQAGAFSRFPGMDRTAVMIRGERLELDGEAGPIVFQGLGQVARFSGDTLLHAHTPSRSVRLWNVMARRGRARACVEVGHEASLTLEPGITAVVFVLAGQYQLCDGEDLLLQLEAGEGLHIDGSTTELQLRPAYPSSSLVHTRIFSEPQGNT